MNVPAYRPCVGMAGATGTYPAGPLATAYSPALHTGVGALDAPGDAQSADQRQEVHDNQTGMSYMAPNRPSVRGDAAQVPTDGHRTGQAPATMTRIHAFPGSDPFVLLPQYREEPPYPSGHPPPLMGEELPCDPPSRQAPPNNRRHPPALIGLLRDRTVDGDIEKNPGPEDAQTTGNDIPPNTERWSPSWLARSKRPPTPTTPLNYTNTRHRHLRRHCKKSDAHPPLL